MTWIIINITITGEAYNYHFHVRPMITKLYVRLQKDHSKKENNQLFHSRFYCPKKEDLKNAQGTTFRAPGASSSP